MPFTNTCIHPRFFGGVRVAHCFAFLCRFNLFGCMLFLVPNVACVSGLSILDGIFDSLYSLYTMYIHLRNYCKAYAFFSIGQIESILDIDVDSDFDIIGRQCLGVLVCW